MSGSSTSGPSATGSNSQEHWFGGGCHCGAVRFRVRLRERVAVECNCSICTKKGYLHVFVEPRDFHLETSRDELSVYRFNTMEAEHTFCRHCGMHPFYKARSHPNHVDVNVRCLDDYWALEDAWVVQPFDGAHWEEHVGEIT